MYNQNMNDKYKQCVHQVKENSKIDPQAVSNLLALESVPQRSRKLTHQNTKSKVKKF